MTEQNENMTKEEKEAHLQKLRESLWPQYYSPNWIEKRLFKQNDYLIKIFINNGIINVEVNTYCNLQGFWGDKDYYTHYIRIEKTDTDKFIEALKKECNSNDLFACLVEKFSKDSADLDVISFCKKNDIAFYYFNNVEGFIESSDEKKMENKRRSLQGQLSKARNRNYYH